MKKILTGLLIILSFAAFSQTPLTTNEILNKEWKHYFGNLIDINTSSGSALYWQGWSKQQDAPEKTTTMPVGSATIYAAGFEADKIFVSGLSNLDKGKASGYASRSNGKLKHLKSTLRKEQAALTGSPAAKEPIKIIDMHIHSYEAKLFNSQARDYYGNKCAVNSEAHFTETYEALKKFNIVKAVVSGTVKSVDDWKAKDTDNRIRRGIMINYPSDDGMDSVKFENLINTGKTEAFGEVGAYYSCTTLSDDIWQPYLRICEKYDIPIAVHTGNGDPGGTYSSSPKARLSLGDPYLSEDVLVKYRNLRIYIMHSGEDWHEHALRLMAYNPQLYSDPGAMLWVEPLTQRYARDFLMNAKQAGYLDRVMFGSDQMTWPYAIKKSIDYLNSLDFLSKEDKQNIFYNNAARFLRLKKQICIQSIFLN
ncbi:MAG: amidohydrolase family protein [Chitinophagaceae bacterium]